MVGGLEVGNEVWASVCVNSDSLGRNNVSVKLVIDPASDAKKMELLVDDADKNSVKVSPEKFSKGETNLTIYGLSAAKDQATIRARVKGHDEDCAILYVKVLPLRNCKLAIYRVRDSDSAATSPVGGPSDSRIVSTLNDVYKQACIKFTKVASGKPNIHYDVDPKDGKAEEIELDTHFSHAWGGKIRAALLKASGIPYDPPDETFMIRGTTGTFSGAVVSVVFVTNIPRNYVTLVVAHELGHFLNIQGHDSPPWPSETAKTKGALMKSGKPKAGVLPLPGRWIRHIDWQKANNKAADFE